MTTFVIKVSNSPITFFASFDTRFMNSRFKYKFIVDSGYCFKHLIQVIKYKILLLSQFAFSLVYFSCDHAFKSLVEHQVNCGDVMLFTIGNST